MHSTVQVLTEDFSNQFRDLSSLRCTLIYMYTAFSQWYILLQGRNFTVKIQAHDATKIWQYYGHDFVVSRFWPTLYNNKNQYHNCKQHESSAATRRTDLSRWDVHKSWTAKVMLSADKTQIETTQSACYQSDITTTQHQLHHVQLNISWSVS